jgi:hypothetical protein
MLKKNEFSKSNSDQRIINVLNRVEQEFTQPIEISEKNVFHQQTLVKVINLYINSKFKNISPEDAEAKGMQFYNIISQALKNAVTKTDIDRKDVIISIKDKIYNYLLNAANVEFMDDYNFGEVVNELVKSYYLYGTGVLKVIDNGRKGSIVRNVEFSSIIWDQAEYETNIIIEKKFLSVKKLLGNKVYHLTELEEALENKKDYNPETTKVEIYEIHGELPENYITNDFSDTGVSNQLHIVASLITKDTGTKKYVLHSSREAQSPYYVVKRNALHGRSMGVGIAEELLQAQVSTNEAVNIMIKDVRSSGKHVWFSTDQELDGVDLSEIDNDVVIMGERDTKLEKINTPAHAFGPAQAYLSQWVGQSKEQSSAQDAALGSNVVSGEAYRARQATINEIDSKFDFEREVIGLFLSNVYKAPKSIGNIVINYISSSKHIEELLTGEQLKSYQGFLADILTEYSVQSSVAKGQDIPSRNEMYDMILKAIQESKEPLVDWGNVEITPKVLLDKMRVLVTNEQVNVQNKIATLKMLATQVMTNPQAYPNIDVKELLNELATLSDSATLVEVFKETRALPIAQPENPQDLSKGLAGIQGDPATQT